MFAKQGILLAFCVLFIGGFAAAFSDGEMQQYQVFKQNSIQEIALRTDSVQLPSNNIFYLTPDSREWEQIDAILDLYFDGLTKENQDQRMAQLKVLLGLYKVTVQPTDPVGLYHIGKDEVFADTSLFEYSANSTYTKSIIYHEKTHQRQNRVFDRELMKVDQRQRYADKLEEIAAHYNQIRFVVEKGDPEAIEMALKNSNRWSMFSGILQSYPGSDRVVRVIRQYMDSIGS